MMRYQDVILNSNGQPVSGATVLVRANGTATAAATIYSTNTGTSTRANPLTADSNGRFWFYGTNGRYDLVVSGSYITTTTAADVMLEDVPLTNLAELSTASSARDNLGLGSAAVVSTATFLKVANNLSDISTAATARANLGVAIGTNVEAFSTAIAKTTQTQTFERAQRGAVVVLVSSASSIPINLGTANHFITTMTEQGTLASPTNAAPGQGGAITFVRGTAANALAFNSFWKWAGTATGTLSTATGSTDVMLYYVYSTSAALCEMKNGLG